MYQCPVCHRKFKRVGSHESSCTSKLPIQWLHYVREKKDIALRGMGRTEIAEVLATQQKLA